MNLRTEVVIDRSDVEEGVKAYSRGRVIHIEEAMDLVTVEFVNELGEIYALVTDHTDVFTPVKI